MKKLLFLALALLPALAALVWIYPRHDLARHWGLEIGRTSGIAKARAIARAQGRNVDDWPAAVRTAAEGWVLELRDRGQVDPVAALQAPWTLKVMFVDPRASHRLEIELNSRGELLGWQEDWEKPPAESRRRAEAEIAVEAAQWLSRLSGPAAARFRETNRGVRQGREEHYSWEWNDPQISPHVARVEVVFVGDRFRSAHLRVQESKAMAATRQDQRSSQVAALALLMILVVLLAFIVHPIFFRALVRGRLRVRSLLVLFSLMAAVWMASMAAGAYWDDRVYASAESFGTPYVDLLGNLIGWALLWSLITVCYGAGRVLIEREDRVAWIGWEQLLRAEWRSARVGEEIAAGMMGGVITAAFAALPGVLGFGSAMLYSSAADFAAFRFAEAWPVRQWTNFVAPGLWFAVWPLARKWRWGPSWIGLALFAGFGALSLGLIHSFYVAGLAATLWSGAALTAGMWVLYRQFGLLAALMGGLSAFASVATGTAAVQPGAEWSAAAIRVAAIYSVPLVIGLLMAARGTGIDEAKELARLEEEVTQQTSGDRDRLMAEFEVARRAQRGMLPVVPPQVGSIELAASCQPAREVGGDLYDFFAMGGGRYGVCVADVSGKGVPASLYMSLTKGYLAAAGPEEADLRSTLTDLNTHLHAAGKKRIFVTMALGVLDTEARTLDLARAGHNAILWRRVRRGESCFVQPKGLGLGITTRLLFERNLEVTRLEMEPGDAVILYSDGVPEAMNLDKQQYGEERLTAAVERCDGASAAEIQTEILRDLHHFIGAAPPHDDITLLVMRYGENGNT